MQKASTYRPKLKSVAGEQSWALRSDRARLHVTRTGGQLGPVEFSLGGKVIRPLAVAPWSAERGRERLTPMIRALRGDFFCAPFGGNDTPFQNPKSKKIERHPPHGETANGEWTLERFSDAGGARELHLSMKMTVREARVEKIVAVVEGQSAIYQRHIISGMTGRMNFGHHAMLQFSARPGAGRLSFSPFVFAQVFPEPIERPENRGYSILKPGARIGRDLRARTITGQTTDLGTYPARRGYEDLVMLVSNPKRRLGWSAVVFQDERFVWFSLKDTSQLPSTILWMSNGGRHYAPWNGRVTGLLGVEEVCSYFHQGLSESVSPNPMSDRGLKTFHSFRPNRPISIEYAMAVAAIPRGFDQVADIRLQPSGYVHLIARSGACVETRLSPRYLPTLSTEDARAPSAQSAASHRGRKYAPG